MSGLLLKDKEEVEEFLRNLGIEYRFSCYHENNAEGCHLLGDYMRTIKSDYERSAKVYKDNCERNKFGRSCTEFGKILYYGTGIAKSVSSAVDYFIRACDSNCVEGCYYAGQFLASVDPKVDIERDMNRSIRYLEKGCGLTKDSALAADNCFELSAYFITGRHGIEKDMKRAFELSVKACQMGHIGACNNLSQMYIYGIGTEKNEELGYQYRNKVIDYNKQIERMRKIEMQRT